MRKDFVEAFSRFSLLKFNDLVSLYKICSFKSFSNGELLAQEGRYCNYMFLIKKGIIRTYVLTQNGDERTTRLAKERDFTTCNQSFLNNNPSSEYLEAIGDCRVIGIDIQKLNELGKTNARILQLTQEGLKEALFEAINRIEFFTTLTPEQRYNKLLDESPDLIQRVPQKYLASFLGVTTVSLSRIKRRRN